MSKKSKKYGQSPPHRPQAPAPMAQQAPKHTPMTNTAHRSPEQTIVTPKKTSQAQEVSARSYTREQRLLQGIHGALTGDTKKLLSRAQSLPMMIQRHGPAQTLLFLESKKIDDNKKSDEDSTIARIFRAALQHAEPGLEKSLPSPDRRVIDGYVGLDLTQRLHLTACCLELANLLMRTIKVQNANITTEAGQ